MKKPPYTPMMMQYLGIKERYQDTLIFFRLGDFYELFFDDAKIASKELSLVLTGKNAGSAERVPMCGIPHHAAKNYIARLVQRGYKVGIVEQLEDPALAKGIVDRDVIQIYTPGAFIDSASDANNFIVAVDEQPLFYSLATCDVSTGELFIQHIEKDESTLLSEIAKLQIKEMVIASSFPLPLRERFTREKGWLMSVQDDDTIRLEFEPLMTSLNDPFMMKTVARLIHYLEQTQKRSLDYLKKVHVITSEKILKIDAFSMHNLELVQSIRSQEKFGTLYWLLDETSTPMGSRLLKQWIVKPSADLAIIHQRQNQIQAFIEHYLYRDQLRTLLKDMYDLSRLIVRVSFGNANARDVLFLKQSLALLPTLKKVLDDSLDPQLMSLSKHIPSMRDVVDLIDRAIDLDAPISIHEGGMIKRGYDATLDEYITLSSGGKTWMLNFELQERLRTGIKNLKVGFNQVFGYYIEISNGQLSAIAPDWGYERKQTLTNGERFITPELKNYELQILNAEEKRTHLEFELFTQIRKKIAMHTQEIQRTSDVIAQLDVLLSLAKVSSDHQWIRPTFHHEHAVHIEGGRHPVIEKVMKVSRYVSNDVIIPADVSVLLITGPNMGGKSTFMRQLSITVVMAQMGCFVPAKVANLMVFDQIFTRIGASDDIVSGQSTFMVEMAETNYALRHATKQSLLVFDEIGRGTATYDGMALAEAIIEYIAQNIQCKSLFSTHYHELTTMHERLPSVQNLQATVKEEADHITFLYKITPGTINKSYGINVAKLANIPPSVLERAQSILHQLENTIPSASRKDINIEPLPLPAWIQDIRSLDPLTLSPMEALAYLIALKKKI
jgi:DNA mismatch repair protein MutS